MQSRRQFLSTTAALGTITLIPFTATAEGHAADSYPTANGTVTVHPVAHATFILETPAGVIYVDPVGGPALYADFPNADLFLITHEHGDHYDADTLDALMSDTATIIANPAVLAMLPEPLKAKASAIANGESSEWEAINIDAIPAYNTTEDRMNFHPQGRDNGYVLSIDGLRIYISGDTKGTPEMRALTDIDVAFVCMNLPFTMNAQAAAEAVTAFAPTYVYPYHYQGRDDGTQDPAEFADLLEGATEVKFGDWYGA
ncbi:MBL fold metallo-hydrolase [Yoonia sp. MH D7]